MKTRGRGLAKRIGVVLAGTMLVGMAFTGTASAQDIPGNTVTDAVTDATDAVTDATTDGSSSVTDAVTDAVSTVTDAVTDAVTTGSSTTTGTGTNTQTVYQPYPVPVIIGDYGHRSYGRYYDNGCGCDRYAAKNYTPQTVVATQVSSTPKGGVDTGDGSFPQ